MVHALLFSIMFIPKVEANDGQKGRVLNYLIGSLSKSSTTLAKNDISILMRIICRLYHKIENKTKWPRQVRELILESDSEILDFLSFDEKTMGKYSAYSAYIAYSGYSGYSAHSAYSAHSC